MSRKPLVALLALAGTLASCDSPSGPAPAGAPAHLDIVSGDPQTGVVGKELSAPLVVKVTDDKGKAVQGQVVNFKVTAGNGTVFAGTGTTDKDGLASERWTLGTIARDTQKVEARAVESSTGATLVFGTFRAIGTPDAPAALTKVAGDAQTGALGAALADSLAVKLADRYGNGVGGQSVAFTVTSGGGSVSPATRATDSLGVARTQWKLGARLDTAQTAAATFGALPAVSFAATATVSGSLAKLSGDGQTGTVAHLLADSLAVRLSLADGSPVKGATIQWTTATGSVLPATSVTDATGTARAAWLLGTAAGPQGVTAAVVGGSQSVGFGATATPDAAATLAIVAGDGQSGGLGTALADSLAVRAADHYGNAVAGVGITWTVTSGGGTAAPTTSTTGASGAAKASWTLGFRADQPQTLRASSGALAPVTFTATAALAGTLAKSAGDTQTGPSGVALHDSLQVTLTTAGGQPIEGVAVQWATSNGSLSPATSPTDAAGHARAAWTLAAAAGPMSATATAAGQTVTFHATGTLGPAALVSAVGATGRTGFVGVPVVDSLAVLVADALGNPVPGVTVTWTASDGGSVAPASAVTDASGNARAQWTPGPVAGTPQTVHAAIGVGPDATFTGSFGVTTNVVVETVSGDGQTAPVGSRLPDTVKVRVRLPDGRPVRHARVQMDVGHESGRGGAPGAAIEAVAGIATDSAAPPYAVTEGAFYTDSAGIARAWWKIGGVAEPGKALRAAAAAGVFVDMHATGTALGPKHVEQFKALIYSDPPAGQPLPEAPRAMVKDTFGNAVGAGVQVQWTTELGSGTANPASSLTDASGGAETHWTLGGNHGVQTLTATVVGTTPPATTTWFEQVSGGTTIGNLTLTPNAAGDSLYGSVTTSGVLSITATVGGRTMTLTFDQFDAVWSGRISRAGLPHDTLAWVVTAIGGSGATAGRTGTFYNNAPPVLSGIVPNDGAVFTGTGHLAATCSDDVPGGCTDLRALLGSTVLTQGTSSISYDMSFTPYNGQALSLLFRGTDSDGKQREVSRTVYSLSNPHLTRVVELTVPGRALDVSTTTVLDYDTTGGSPRPILVDRASGATTSLAPVGGQLIQGLLGPGGAIVIDPQPPRTGFNTPTYGTVFNRVAGHTDTYMIQGTALGQAGTAVFVPDDNQRGVAVLDMTTGAVTRITGASCGNVSSAGDVVYCKSGSFYRYHPADGTTQTLQPYLGQPQTSVLDGTDLVYSTLWTVGSVFQSALLRNTDTLAVASWPFAWSNQQYDAVDGWTVYAAPGSSNQSEIWRISPAGVKEKITSFSTSSTLEALGGSGVVVYSNGTTRYLSVPGQAPVSLGASLGTVVRREGGALFVLLGNSVFQINP